VPARQLLLPYLRYRKFAYLTGSVPYDHCSPIIGLEFKKPGYLTTNRFTLPSRTVPLSHLMCPKNRDHPPSTRKSPALTAAGAYTDSFASFSATTTTATTTTTTAATATTTTTTATAPQPQPSGLLGLDFLGCRVPRHGGALSFLSHNNIINPLSPLTLIL